MTARARSLESQAQAARRGGPSPAHVSGELRPGVHSSENLRLSDLEAQEQPTSVVRLGGRSAAKLVLVLAVAAAVAYLGINQVWNPQRLPPAQPTATPPPSVAAPATPQPASVRPEITPLPSEPAPAAAPAEAPPPASAEAPRPASAPAPAGVAAEPPPSYEKVIADADHQLESGSSEKARVLYERAIKLRPGGAEALAGLGYIALDRGRTPQAFSYFKRSLAHRPGFGTALFGLAESYRATGDDEIALEHYRRYLAADPGGTDAQAARQHIKTLEGRLAARGAAASQAPPATP
jgi:tetratricopeptide (TPR) repeat protein